MDACHGVKGYGNDSLENLSWGTYSKNNYDDMLRDGTLVKGEDVITAKLKERQVREIRSAVGTHQEIADRYNISRSQVTRIINYKRWRWLE